MKVSEISKSGKTVYLLLFLSVFQLLIPADENQQALHSFFHFSDGTILAKYLEYTRPSSSDSESELLSFGSEKKGYTTRSMFSSVEAGIRGFDYYTPAVTGRWTCPSRPAICFPPFTGFRTRPGWYLSTR